MPHGILLKVIACLANLRLVPVRGGKEKQVLAVAMALANLEDGLRSGHHVTTVAIEQHEALEAGAENSPATRSANRDIRAARQRGFQENPCGGENCPAT